MTAYYNILQNRTRFQNLIIDKKVILVYKIRKEFMSNLLKLFILLTILASTAIFYTSCGSDNPITQIFSNEVSAKQRLDSANAESSRNFPGSKLVLIFGKNVKSDGKTDISTYSAITDPSQIGTWLYIYRVPSDTANLRVYTPNPLPGSSDCIELTSFFSISEIIGLIQDTSAKNIVSGALTLLTNANVNITTTSSTLIDSDVSLGLANTTSPIIKFDNNFTPDTSLVNGSTFFSAGTNQTINMFLIPAAGTLNLPPEIPQLTGFPADLWVVNYKKNTSDNLILGTVVQSGQIMGISQLGLQSKVINLSKYEAQ